jgi:pyruvate dehydrogenase E1 component beta subunit
MIAAIRDNNPVIYIDDRWLYNQETVVPKKIYEVPIGKGIIKKNGTDLTIAALSYLVPEAIKAAEKLSEEKISVEVVDIRTAKPLDIPLILKSVKKTGRLIIADPGWLTGGVSAEIAAQISNLGFQYLKCPVERHCLPDCPAPMSKTLEEKYYPKASDIINKIRKILIK